MNIAKYTVIQFNNFFINLNINIRILFCMKYILNIMHESVF